MKEHCEKDHCHDCAKCGYERPMTEGEAEIARGLDEALSKKEDTWAERFDVLHGAVEDGDGDRNRCCSCMEGDMYDVFPAQHEKLKAFIAQELETAKREGAREAVEYVRAKSKELPFVVGSGKDPELAETIRGWMMTTNPILEEAALLSSKK